MNHIVYVVTLAQGSGALAMAAMLTSRTTLRKFSDYFNTCLLPEGSPSSDAVLAVGDGQRSGRRPISDRSQKDARARYLSMADFGVRLQQRMNFGPLVWYSRILVAERKRAMIDFMGLSANET